MSFTAEGARGTATLATTVGSDQDRTLSVSPSSDIAAGQLVVVWFACDSVHNAATPADTLLNQRMSCHDDVGNYYSTLAAHTDGQSNIYAMGAIFISRLEVALTTSDTISIQYRAVGGGGKSAVSLEEFSMDSTKRWATTDRGPSCVTIRATDPQGVGLSSLDSREYLFLHALCAEGPDSDAYTWDADYTQITGTGTTGGTADTNIHIRGGYRIATLTSDTVDVASDTADRDYTQLLVAVTEVNYDDEFPIEAILDDFNRTDEEPLSWDGNWDTNNCSAGIASGTPRYLRIVSNVAAGSSATGAGGSWWIDEIYQDPDGEVWVTISTSGAAAITFNGSGCANGATADGLAAMWVPDGFEAGALSVRDNIICGGGANVGGVDDPAFRTWVDLAAGVKFGIQRRAPVLHLWVDDGGGWTWVGAVYANENLSGYGNGGKLGLQAHSSGVRLDDFGGGPLFRPSFYRRR